MTSRIAPATPPGPMPAIAGIGLRAAHVQALLATPALQPGWLEVHSENYFADGGFALEALLELRTRHPVALHGVGLALGSAEPLDREHVRKLVRLRDRVRPWAVSEHLCWGRGGGEHANDLLPMPRTGEARQLLVARIDEVQQALGERLLIENLSSYFEFQENAQTEAEFLAQIVDESDCGLLLDVNNIVVNAHNHGFDAREYIGMLPADAIAEIHLAGHETIPTPEGELRLDTHDRVVPEEVWALFEQAIAHLGPRPTLIEWDARLPELPVLLGEAAKAQARLEALRVRAA